MKEHHIYVSRNTTSGMADLTLKESSTAFLYFLNVGSNETLSR